MLADILGRFDSAEVSSRNFHRLRSTRRDLRLMETIFGNLERGRREIIATVFLTLSPYPCCCVLPKCLAQPLDS